MVEFGLALLAVAQQGLATLFKATVQTGQKFERLVAEDIAIAGLEMAQDFDAGWGNERHVRLL